MIPSAPSGTSPGSPGATAVVTYGRASKRSAARKSTYVV